MFLITTADQRFWKTDGPVLFLGEWCKLYSQRALWQNMNHEVLEYHWDDRKTLFDDYKYLQVLYERILKELTQSLNEIHQVNHSLRYWRIIIGPWLFYFIHVFYDRYACINTASESNKVTDTTIGKYFKKDWVPKDYSEFSSWVARDEFNFFLYSWIIEQTQPFFYHYQTEQTKTVISNKQIEKNKSLVKKLCKSFILAYEKCLPHRFNKYVIISSYLNPMDQWRLQISLRQWPSLFAPEAMRSIEEVNLEMRNCFSLSQEGDQFEKLLFKIIPQQIPQVYVEDYTAFKEQALARYPAQPKAVVTANDLYSNEDFKFFAATHVEKGTRLISLQHGGGYGNALFYAGEEHEIKVSDNFYSWGWKAESESKVKPLAAAALNRFKNDFAFDNQGDILLTLGLVPRYSYHLYSIYVSSNGVLAYLNDQLSFVKALDSEAREKLLIRTFPQDFGWSQKDRFKEISPEIRFDNRKSIFESMKKSRLCVMTYNSTTYLESFIANIPTILFWNPERWELRDSAKLFFEELRMVGILHDSPQSAAKKINEIWSDPMAWWQEKKVQHAKNSFCSNYAKTSDCWLSEWKSELKALI